MQGFLLSVATFIGAAIMLAGGAALFGTLAELIIISTWNRMGVTRDFLAFLYLMRSNRVANRKDGQ